MRLCRRVAELEARVTTLEAATGVSYDMPPRYDIDVTPHPPVVEHHPYDGPPLETEEEPWDTPTGVYL